MPQGKGTYGSKVGRPKKEKKENEEVRFFNYSEEVRTHER
jgi:hypothetical protein